ncbi:WecB/TagA/CpsF family glycosyltransferase [Methylomonas methanica]|uniref:Glycosyl transferase, WecB/TagA/CpsF family n=1 Tax=Methylomonas methanica (strain DSM 25384 / MC09) TaxID=857087 RepID=G0A253_METMM|nr:WecB/TagA/CpsF family glycosyltransferase [Methylomonas methanica]AEG02596.1 glycosyl transferase, WecB/TagA/CpsF family [Methylomonas methanica MC09]
MSSPARGQEFQDQLIQSIDGIGSAEKGISHTVDSLYLFGLRFTQASIHEAVDQITKAARVRRCGFVVTPNVNMLTLLPFEPDLREISNRALFQFVDGWPIVWASKRLHKRGLPERVAGSDLFPLICRRAAQQGLSMALMGAAEGVAEEAARRLTASYPKLNIVGTYCPPMEAQFSEQSNDKMVAFCNQTRPDILVLGMGIPKQERWIAANIDNLDIGVALCFGGVIDFAAGKIQRSPPWVVRVGMEWLWRLFMSPRQYWKRTLLRFPLFFPMFFKELLTRRA